MPYFISNSVLDQFEHKRLEDIFQDLHVVETEYGEFIKIKNGFGCLNPSEHLYEEELSIFQHFAKRNLKFIPGITTTKSENFKRKNLTKIDDLIGISQIDSSEIQKICDNIRSKNSHELKTNKNVKEEDLLFCAKPEEILFLDIETTGQINSQIFLLGLGFIQKKEITQKDGKKYTEKYQFVVEQLFAREISEEIAILRYFIEIIPNFKLIVTYNGKNFDMPFISNRIIQLMDLNDVSKSYQLIFDKDGIELGIDGMMKDIIENLVHIDLFHTIRRTYKGMFENYRLITTEQKLLNFYREDNLESEFVPQVYIDWINDNKKYMGGIYKVLEHNFNDVINMARILKVWISEKIHEYYEKMAFSISSLKPEQKEIYNNQQIIQKLKEYFSKEKKTKVFTLDNYFSR